MAFERLTHTHTMLEPGAKAAQRDMFDMPLAAGTLAHQDAILQDPGVIDLLTCKQVYMVPSKGGVRVIKGKATQEEFIALTKDLEQRFGSDSVERGKNLGFYEENPWDKPEGQVGQQYAKLIDDKELPRLIENFNKTAPDVARQLNELDRVFSQEYGFPLNTAFMELREAIQTQGFDGIRAMATKYGLPLASVLLALGIGAQSLPSGDGSPRRSSSVENGQPLPERRLQGSV